ncbi:uncharacterized protein LOC132619269 isoform X2 [Lycium barbarum]|uniref:uncharacterized protein LOC132619269 isoform X2 n=1 Tax=Lycium barbarum TaxID=112863 RepID=UPI00293F1F58|nr:uncharacterized protein LOC132619269 isoform X2 [Lycium barbarum]
MQILPTFINEHKKMLAKTCLLHTNEGVLWEAKIMRKNSYFCICEGDWPQFVVYHKLRPGDILLFLLVDKSTFLVVPYTQKSGRNFRRRQSFEELSSNSEEEDIEPSRNSKESSSVSEEESIDPSCCSKDGEYPSCLHLGVTSNVKADEMIHLKKKIVELDLFRWHVSDLDNPKRPLGSFIVFMEEFKKRCLEVNPNIKSFDAIEKVGGDKWKQMSDAEKAPYVVEAEKRRVEYAKVLNLYNRLVAAEEEESDKSRSEVVASKNGENPCYAHLGDKSNAKANYVFHTKKKARGLRRLARDLDKPPQMPASAYFIFMEEFRKQFREQNPSIKSIAAEGKASGSKWKQMSDAEKAPYLAEEEKRKLEYAKRMNVYNRRVATEEEEYSDESSSEFDDEEGSGEEDEDENLYTFFFSR